MRKFFHRLPALRAYTFQRFTVIGTVDLPVDAVD
jgi:hypothetical protein